MKKIKLNSIKLVGYVMILTIASIAVSCSNAQNKNEASTDIKVDIHTAALTGNLEAIKQHIAAGTDLNSKEPMAGSTPMITASVFGKPEVVKALVEAGADINIQNNDGSSALHTAAFFGYQDIVEVLIKNGADQTLKNNFGATAKESVSTPYSDVRPVYDYFINTLGPMGLEISHDELQTVRPIIAEMLQ
ncbi:MAG: ankyrin repeat domain-containing protein [bacterium]|nr:ankyrin repeat domain-containing protein [bacterium]